jgi:hypothetical protein
MKKSILHLVYALHLSSFDLVSLDLNHLKVLSLLLGFGLFPCTGWSDSSAEILFRRSEFTGWALSLWVLLRCDFLVCLTAAGFGFARESNAHLIS